MPVGGARVRPIVAAGTVLWRPGATWDGRNRGAGDVEIAIIHRPKYDDWSLPKGKSEPDEHPTVTAIRETEEETGFGGYLARPLGSVRYDVASDGEWVPKVVHYWSMQARTGAFAPSDEVDRLEWVAPGDALSRLGRREDRAPVERFLAAPALTTTVLLIRHARAGDRNSWGGDDEDRPLDPVGMRQTRQITAIARCFGITEVVSADVVRCQQTVAPLAAVLGLPIEQEPALSEGVHQQDPGATVRRFDELVAHGGAIAICSQGGVIPDLLATLRGRGPVRPAHVRPRKGSLWLLSFDTTALVGARYLDSDGIPR